MLEYFLKGGVIMWPILLCSIMSFFIIIERLIFYKSISFNPLLIQKFIELVNNKQFERAKKILENFPEMINKILSKGLEEYYSPNLRDIIEDIATQYTQKLERFLPLLAAIASISTLLGFTGTVIGMIKAFESIAAVGYASPQVVAKGIAEALITTAAGLIVAIPTIAFYHYFNYRVNRYINSLEHYLQEFINTKK